MHGLYKTSLSNTSAIAPPTKISFRDSASAIVPVANTPVREVTGRKLSHVLKLGDITSRALLARDLKNGTLRVRKMTCAQAAAVAGVSVTYLMTACRANPDESCQLTNGFLTIAELITKHRHFPLISDEEVVDVVRKLGPERVNRALDLITAPVMQAAE